MLPHSVSQLPVLPARAYPSRFCSSSPCVDQLQRTCAALGGEQLCGHPHVTPTRYSLMLIREGVGSESLPLAASSTAALPNAPKAAGQLKALCSEFDHGLLLGVAA